MKNIENYLEKENVDILLATAKACNFRDYLMLRILWRTGMRISELLSIRPQDLEAHNQVINITKAKGNKQRRVYAIDNQPQSQAKPTASGESTTEPLSQHGGRQLR